MIENSTTLKSFFSALTIALVGFISMKSQTISKPTFLFTKACASDNFNTYPVNFNFSPVASFATNNIFYLQLSDATGSFAAPIEVASSSTITSSPGQIVYLVPQNFVGGEGYKFRIRSTSPALLSPESNIVPIYYQSFIDNFYINNRFPTAKYCTGSSILLSIDEPFSPPTTVLNLAYRWYKDAILIAGATQTSITANSPGIYYCEINYGACSTIGSITRSQDVIVTAVPGLQPILISSTLGTNVAIGSPTTLSTVQNSTLAYQWHKDGLPIAGATNFNFSTDQAGEYFVVAKNSSCSVESNKIVLISSLISSATLIPNVISPNNDGVNDTWAIPAQYISGTNTEIIITDTLGKEVLKTKNYINDWPTNSIDYQAFNPVFYYMIIPTNAETKKGTITIIK